MKTWSFTLNNIFQKLFFSTRIPLKICSCPFFFLSKAYTCFFFFFSDVTKLLENTEVEAAKIDKLRFLSHMKAIKTNTDARRLLNIHYKEKCLCFKGTDVMSLVFVAVERCVFSLLFYRFLIQKFLKTNDIVIHSLIQRIFMQIVVETCAKKPENRTRKRSLCCVNCSVSVANFPTKITTSIFA